MANIQEIWKDIAGYEGLYQISNLARVKSLERILWNGHGFHLRKEIILKNVIANHGYNVVNLRKAKGLVHTVHRLVAIAFIHNPHNKPEVNHINGIRHDNSISNLEWVTSAENKQHAYTHCGRKGAFTGKFGKNHHISKPVRSIDSNGEIKEYFGIRDAERTLGIRYGNIAQCLCGKNKLSFGLKWEYA